MRNIRRSRPNWGKISPMQLGCGLCIFGVINFVVLRHLFGKIDLPVEPHTRNTSPKLSNRFTNLLIPHTLGCTTLGRSLSWSGVTTCGTPCLVGKVPPQRSCSKTIVAFSVPIKCVKPVVTRSVRSAEATRGRFSDRGVQSREGQATDRGSLLTQGHGTGHGSGVDAGRMAG